jgi:Domain of unknown function (DUF4158)
LIGSTLLSHVCAQLRIEGVLFLDYPHRQPTRYDHIERIKQYLGLRSFVADDQAMAAGFVREQVRAGTPPDDLLQHSASLRASIPGTRSLKLLACLIAEGCNISLNNMMIIGPGESYE